MAWDSDTLKYNTFGVRAGAGGGVESTAEGCEQIVSVYLIEVILRGMEGRGEEEETTVIRLGCSLEICKAGVWNSCNCGNGLERVGSNRHWDGLNSDRGDVARRAGLGDVVTFMVVRDRQYQAMIREELLAKFGRRSGVKRSRGFRLSYLRLKVSNVRVLRNILLFTTGIRDGI